MSDTPAPDYTKYADIAEIRRLGIIQEVNRLLLHPLGLALEVKVTKDGEHLSGIWDCRHDPEGIIFDEGYLSPDKAIEVANMIEARGPARINELGYVIQPVTTDAKQLSLTVKEPTEWTSDDDASEGE